MAFDDETIRIQVDGAQAQAQLQALETEVSQLTAELKMLNSTAGVTNAEINGTTKRLGEAEVKLAQARARMAEFGGGAQAAGLNMKDLTKSIGAGISIIGILQENLRALEPALKDVGNGIKFAFESAGADAETMDNLGRAMDSLIHPSHIMANAVENMRLGWKKLIDTMEESSTVVVYNSKSIKESLDLIEEARKKAAQATEDAAKKEEKALKDAQKAEEDLEKAAVKSAEARAKAHADALEKMVGSLDGESKARRASTDLLLEAIQVTESHGELTTQTQEKIKAGIEAELSKYTEYGDVAPAALNAAAEAYRAIAGEQEKVIANAAKLEADQARLDAALAKGSKLDTSQDTTEVEKNLSDLKRKIKEIESQDLISPEQIGQLGDLKDQAADLTRSMGDLNRVFTVGAEDFLNEANAADAAAAAWDVYRDRIAQAQQRHDDANRTIGESEDVFDSVADSADGAAGSLEDVADAAGDIGKEAEKGAKKAAEGLGVINEGADQVIPKLQTIKGLLVEIKQAAAEVDL